MARKKKLIDKKAYKLSNGKCRICGEPDYALLDTHRIVPGSEGGAYTIFNTVCLCCKCHRKVHDNQIKIHKYYLCSSGSYVLHITENDKERFI